MFRYIYSADNRHSRSRHTRALSVPSELALSGGTIVELPDQPRLARARSCSRINLHQSILCLDTTLVREMLAVGADVNQRNYEGRTPLHCAVTVGSEGLTRLLLEAKANPNIPDNKGNSALHTAIVWESDKRMLNLLLHFGADKDFPGRNHFSPLQWAIFSSNLTAIQVLIAARADFAHLMVR